MAEKRSGLGKGLDSLIPASRAKSSSSVKAAPQKEEPKEVKKKAPKTTVKAAAKPAAAKAKPAAEKVQTAPAARETDIKAPAAKKGVAPLEGVLLVNINKIEPNRQQPRKYFDEDSLLELADSIRQFGVLQPLIVQEKENYYEIIAGERRWRAAKKAGIKQIPVIVKEYSERELIEIALIENIQREDLNPIEEAKAYRRLLDDYQLKQDELADRVSKSRTSITNSMRLLKLDEKVQEMLISEMLTPGHARALLAITSPEEQRRAAGIVFDDNLSVRETEKLVKKLTGQIVKKPAKKAPSADRWLYQDMEEKMKSVMGTKVVVSEKKKGKGTIEIEYYSEKDLDRIYHLLMSIR